MLGAIIGDIVGSIYERHNIKTKDFELFGQNNHYTDDSVLSVATADWLLHGGKVAPYYAHYGVTYHGGYGRNFKQWAIRAIQTHDFTPYNSCGNGSAMRVAPVGWISLDKEHVMEKAKESAICTHNHPEGIKGAQSTALCILLARQGVSKGNIRNTIEREFAYDLSMSVEELQSRYSWNGIDGNGYSALCQDSVPQAIICALKSNSFEDAIRNAVSIGGDCDTISCITGSIAEALYGIPEWLKEKAMSYLPAELQRTIKSFYQCYIYNTHTTKHHQIKIQIM